MGVTSELQNSIENSIEKSKAVVRNYFAHRDVYPAELPGVMRKHIYTGVMGSTFFTLIGGLFYIEYGNTIGLTRLLWGAMWMISGCALASQLLSAYITERIRRRKLLWFLTALAGRVLRVSVGAGETVAAGQSLLVLEAMKMENEVKAPRDGVVDGVGVAPGQAVSAGEVLIRLRPES